MSAETNEELPAGWVRSRLEPLTTKVGSGATPRGGEASYKKSGIPLIRSMNVVFFGFKKDGLAFLDDDQAKALANVEVNSGDVLLNITGASIGRVTQAPPEMAGARVNQHVCIVRPTHALDARFLNAYLSSPAIQQQIFGENYGVTRQALTKQQILDFDILLAPLAEQKRIADKLEAVLGRVDTCRARLDRIPALLKRFRQSVLAAATSGKLTEDWRQENEAPHDWKSTNLGNILTDIRYGTAKKCHYEPKATPVLRIPNIRDGYVVLEDIKFAEFEASELKTLGLRSGDLLVIRSNGSIDLVGKVALASEKEAGYLYAGYLIRLRLNAEEAIAGFVAISLRSPSTRAVIELTARSTSGVNNLNTEELKALEVVLPPLPEQQEIIRRVEALFSLADQIGARLETAHRLVERLTPAVLSKAFCGELVPQDPNDEPASVLLERLRQSAPDAAMPRQRGGKKREAQETRDLFHAAPAPSSASVPAAAAAITTARAAMLAAPATAAVSKPPARRQPEPASTPQDRVNVEDLDKEDLMSLLREVLAEHGPCDRETAIQKAAHALGYKRTGSVVTPLLDNAIRTAVRRRVLFNEAGELRVNRASIAEMEAEDRPFMKEQFLAAISQGGKTWIEREDAARLFANWFGFRRTGHAVQDRVKSLINGLIRDKALQSASNCIRQS